MLSRGSLFDELEYALYVAENIEKELMMAVPPSEENARVILDIYAHFKSTAGSALKANNFLAVGTRKHVRVADLQSGLNYAADVDWIEGGPNGSLRLTQSGFEHMRRAVEQAN